MYSNQQQQNSMLFGNMSGQGLRPGVVQDMGPGMGIQNFGGQMQLPMNGKLKYILNIRLKYTFL